MLPRSRSSYVVTVMPGVSADELLLKVEQIRTESTERGVPITRRSSSLEASVLRVARPPQYSAVHKGEQGSSTTVDVSRGNS